MYLLIAKSLNRETSAAEQSELEAWLREDDAHKDIYEDMKRLWSDSDALFEQPTFDTGAAWQKVAALTTDVIPSVAKKTAPFRKWFVISAAAAALVIFIAINLFSPDKMETVTAGNQVLAVELPDHSRVKLQPGSTLHYPKTFSGGTRAVTLEGDAFFDVQRDEQQAFIIDAHTVDIKVLGTSFYVSTHTKQATVTVVTGKVSMTPKDNREKLLLTPGQKGIYENQTLTTTTDTNFVYYREGILHFNGVTFAEAIAVMGTVKNSDIKMDSSLSPAQRQQMVAISFKDQDIEVMLQEICLITHTAWKKDKAGYLISAR